MNYKLYIRRVALLLTVCLFLYGHSSAKFSLFNHSRGYNALTAADSMHYTPFLISSIYSGMGKMSPIEEITVSDIFEISKYFNRTVVLLHNIKGKVDDFPLEKWEKLQDTLRKYSSRLVVITGRYDEWDKLQEQLSKHPISFQIYVLSGKKYGDDYKVANNRYWHELVKDSVPKKERKEYNTMMMVMGKTGIRTFLPNWMNYFEYIFY